MIIVIRLAALAGAIAATTAHATPFDVRFESEAAGIQRSTATFSTGGVEAFDTRATGFTDFTTNFGTGGAITGTYTGVQIHNADRYGGAGGRGRYAVSFSSTGYALDLVSTVRGGVNYFGYWLSALDRGNQVTFFSHGKKRFTFNPADVVAAVNAHANPAAYYGNPNARFAGANRSEPYIFLNFFANRGSFDRVVFAEIPARGGYESDNHTVGHFLTKGTGTNVALSPASFTAVVPEPATWTLALGGLGMVGATIRRRRALVVTA